MSHGMTIAQQVATALGLTLGVEVFNGPVRPEPTRAVFCLVTGGITPEDIVENSGESYHRPRVQIRVRDAQQDFAGGEVFATSVRDAVHLQVPAGYIECRAVESAPMYLGPDDQGRHEWSINVELLLRE